MPRFQDLYGVILWLRIGPLLSGLDAPEVTEGHVSFSNFASDPSLRSLFAGTLEQRASSSTRLNINGLAGSSLPIGDHKVDSGLRALFSFDLDSANVAASGGKSFLAHLVFIHHRLFAKSYFNCLISIFKTVWKAWKFPLPILGLQSFARQYRPQLLETTVPGSLLFMMAGLASHVQHSNYKVYVEVSLEIKEHVIIDRGKHEPALDIRNHPHIQLKAIRSGGTGTMAKREISFHEHSNRKLLRIVCRLGLINDSLSSRIWPAQFNLYGLQLRASLSQTVPVNKGELHCSRTDTRARFNNLGRSLFSIITGLGQAHSWISGLQNTGRDVVKPVVISAKQMEINSHDIALSASGGHTACKGRSWRIWSASMLTISNAVSDEHSLLKGHPPNSQITPNTFLPHISLGTLPDSSRFLFYSFTSTIKSVGLPTGSTSPFQNYSAVGRSTRSLLYTRASSLRISFTLSQLGEPQARARPPPPPPPPQPLPTPDD